MIELILVVTMAILLLKIVWNLSIPYILFIRSINNRAMNRGGISLMPLVDITLIVIIITLSFIAQNSSWPWSAGCIAFGCGISTMGSYLHLVVAGAIMGCVARKIHKRKSTERPGPS